MSKQHTIVLIPGDGIGPEVTHAACRVLEAATAGPKENLRGHVAEVFALLGPRAGLNKAQRRAIERMRREWDDAIVAATITRTRERPSLER